MHFLHGVSPDGETLAYIGLEPEGADWWARANIFLIRPRRRPSSHRRVEAVRRMRIHTGWRVDLLQHRAVL